MARQSEAATLRWLHRFGYLTPAQVGRLVWPQSKNAGSRLRMAQRVIARLASDDRVIAHKGNPGESSHVGLSLSGAGFLRTEYGIEDVVSAKDMLRTTSRHRDACNDSAIQFIVDGWSRTWTEREIVTGKAPFRELGKKVPDCAAADADGQVTWVEIENCRRGGRDMQHLASWLHHWAFPSHGRLVPLDLAERFWLVRVRFILAAPAALSFEGRLRRAMAEHGWSDEPRQQVEFQLPAGQLLVW